MKGWVNFTGGKFYLETPNDLSLTLEPSVYELCYDDDKRTFFLKFVSEKFILPSKMYGFDNKFIDWVVKSDANLKENNIGILLSGIKGTGKSITGQVIANRLERPVILINSYYQNICEFINRIDQEVVIFIDEYEKLYSGSNRSGDLLTIMDGVIKNGYKRTFILTCNNTDININLLDRPGRIRYHRTYKGLSRNDTLEIIKDRLKVDQEITKLIDFFETIEIITVDIVKSIIDELNIHNCTVDEFKDFFNFTVSERRYDIYQKFEESFSKIERDRKVRLPFVVGNSFAMDGHFMGKITEVIGETMCQVHSKEIYLIRPVSRSGFKE